jgi:hypothetical protein
MDGRLGIDKACAIVSVLTPALATVPLDKVSVAESAIVQDASDFTADEVRIQALIWHAAIDPDGIEPSEERAMAGRGIRLGRVRDGIVPISGALMPEVAGGLKRLFDAYLSPRSAPAFLGNQELREQAAERDSRTPDQQRHDVFAGLIDAASRATEAPSIGGAAPTVLVSVRADDLERGRGAGYIDGVDAPVSLRAVKQYVCSGGTQRVVIDDAGRIIELGSPQRTFTPQQRRAISARDGGCIIPGCSVPAAWCEIHHVLPDRDGGPTHTDNGVLLCWFHHRTLDTAGWQVRMSRGAPQVKAPPWIDRDAPWRAVTKSRTRMTDGIDRPPW